MGRESTTPKNERTTPQGTWARLYTSAPLRENCCRESPRRKAITLFLGHKRAPRTCHCARPTPLSDANNYVRLCARSINLTHARAVACTVHLLCQNKKKTNRKIIALAWENALSTDWNGKHQCFTLLLPPGKMRSKALARAPAQRCARAAPLRVKGWASRRKLTQGTPSATARRPPPFQRSGREHG